MRQRFYPAVLERGRHETYGVWFPDFPGAIAAARSQEEAMAKAQDALALAVEAMAERGEPLPAPCPLESIEIPPGCDLVSLFAVSVEPPDPSERINVYLPKSLITRVDRQAADFGMSRSSFVGLALSAALSGGPKAFGALIYKAGHPEDRAPARTKVKRRKAV